MFVRGRLLEFERPSRLTYTWNASWDTSRETTIQYDLTPIPAGTRLNLQHTGFSREADRNGYREGDGTRVVTGRAYRAAVQTLTK